MSAVFSILFAVAFLVLASVALGTLLLRGAGAKLHRGEEQLLGFVCGAAGLSVLVFALCALRLAGWPAFLGLGGCILAVGYRRGLHRLPGESFAPLEPPWKLLLAIVFAAYLYVYFPNALAPETSPDGTTYHLGLVARYLRDGGFVPLPDHMYAQLSQGVEMLFLFAFAFARHSAASLTHLCFLLALPLLMVCYGRRFGFGRAGACAAILVFASPVAGVDGTSAYNDIAVACAVFTVFYLVQIWWTSARAAGWRWPAAVGLMAGFCFAAKYTAFLAVPYALAGLLLRRVPRPFRSAAIVAAAAALVALPWLVKNWLVVRNPVSPMLNTVFVNPYMHAGFDREYASFLRLYELKSRWEIPKAVTTTGLGGVAGVTGPLFLLAPAGLLALRVPQGRQLWAAAAVFGLAYPFNIGTRFLLPVLPFVSLAMALVLTRYRWLGFGIAVVHAVISWPSLVPKYAHPDSWRIGEIPWKAALRLEPEDAYLARRVPSYGIAKLIDQHVPPGERVFSFGGVAEAYTSREIVSRYQSALGKNIGVLLWTPVIPDYHPTWQHWFRWGPRLLRRVRVFQTAYHPTDYWSIAEFRLFHAGKELPRRPEWRLRAWPNSFEVQYAFDNSLMTRWSTWQPLFTGMYVEVDFGRDEMVDSALLQMSHDQYGIELKLDGRYPNGHWQALSGGEHPQDVEAPRGMRRTVTQEVKSLGIRYLLIQDTDHEAADYRDAAPAWGLTQLAEDRAFRLYRID
jgi:hypothetical protein